jgi:hypothetical protein
MVENAYSMTDAGKGKALVIDHSGKGIAKSLAVNDQ